MFIWEKFCDVALEDADKMRNMTIELRSIDELAEKSRFFSLDIAQHRALIIQRTEDGWKELGTKYNFDPRNGEFRISYKNQSIEAAKEVTDEE